MNSLRHASLLLLFFGLTTFKNVDPGIAQSIAAAIGAKAAEAIAHAMMGAKFNDSFQFYQETLATFIKYSKQTRAIDWCIFNQMQANKWGIGLNSSMEYLAQCATKVETITKSDVITHPLYYPVLFPLEKAQMNHFEIPKIGNASSELALMLNAYGAQCHAQAPIFHVESGIGSSRLYFTVEPMAQGSAVLDQFDALERIKSFVRIQIAQNPELNIKYQQAAYANASMLKSMVLAKNSAEMIKAQFSIKELNLIDVFDEGYVLNNEIIPQLQHIILKNGHGNPAFTLEQRGEVLQVVAPYFKYLARTLNKSEIYSSFLNECITANIPGADLLIQRLHGTNSWRDAARCWFSSLWSSIPNPIDNEIVNCQFFNDFFQLEQLCKKQQFDQTKMMVESYRNRISTAKDSETAMLMANEMQALRLTHDHYYHHVFNQYDIRYDHTDDPYYIIAKQLLETCPIEQKSELLATVKETIFARQAKIQDLFTALKTDGKNSLIRAFGYRLIDAQSPQEIVQILAPLAIDHPEADYRFAYSVFINKGYPKWIVQNIKNDVSRELELMANTKARILYGLAGTIQAKSQEQEAQIMKLMEYLNKSCVQKKLMQENLYLAEKLYEAIVHGDGSEIIFRCPNFNDRFLLPEQVHSAEKLMQLSVRSLQKIDEIRLTAGDSSNLQAVFAQVLPAFKHIQDQEVEIAKRWMEKVIEPSIEAGFLTPEAVAESQLLVWKNARPIIHNECSVLSEEKEFPYCVIPEVKNDWLHGGDELIFDEKDLATKACLPGLIAANELLGCGSDHEEVIDLDKIPQCNWGKGQQLPSFGESPSIEEKEKVNAISGEESAEIKKREEKVKEEKSSEKENEKNLDSELEKFKKEIIKETIEEVARRYGEEYSKKIIDEALQIFPPNEYNFKKYKDYNERLERLIIDLAKIRSNSRWSQFTNDPAHGNKIKVETIDEALAGVACEEEGLLKDLNRSEQKEAEFIEILESGKKQLWDVKTFPAYTPDGQKYIFNAESYVNNIKEELMEDENIIINIAYLPDAELKSLFDKLISDLAKHELGKILFVDPYHQNRTRRFNKLLNDLRL